MASRQAASSDSRRIGTLVQRCPGVKADFDPQVACTVATLRIQAPFASVEQRGHSEEEAGEEPANANDSGVVHSEALPMERRHTKENITRTLPNDERGSSL